MHGALALTQKPLLLEAVLRYQVEESAELLPGTDLPRRWYALLVESGRERRICIWLRRRQYEPYWPRYKGFVKLNRHRTEVRWRSVIPGYLFIPIPILQTINCDLIESAPGARRIMRNGENLVELPEDGRQGIERIKEIEAALNASAIAAAEGIPFKEGQKVRIRRVELDGKIKRIASKTKIVVEAQFFGAVREWELPVSEIEAV
ncbi:MAG TPA: transcription termination/antitermination NusG family protein [Bryobacteraceae bacterium]|nr:transcription termination/antitermination NusG family protein [Bryobacteraceae bacterium]